MIKKILFLFIILISSHSFSQDQAIDKLIASPNPFTNSTKISFHTTENQNILIEIKNILGKTVFFKEINASQGKNSINFNRNDLQSGMYMYSIQSNKEFISKRFVIK